MSYSVAQTLRFRRELLSFARYCNDYSEEYALDKKEEIDDIIINILSQRPLSYNYFELTGIPYRAYLYKAGKRTQFWIVYRVSEATKTVTLISLWNAMRDPLSFKP